MYPRPLPGDFVPKSVTSEDAIQQQLQVMDITALSLCMENNLPILVFDVRAPDGIYRALTGEHVGTVVSSDAPEAASAI